MPSTKKPLLELVLSQLDVTDEKTARALIMAGKVYADGQKLTTPAVLLPALTKVSRSQAPVFVSRAGHKLEFAINEFDLQLRGLCVADIGSSTGGFVDCALKHGASRVYAVDVGVNQLSYSLRSDPRVITMEKTNVKDLVQTMFAPLPDLAVCDVSFISLRHVFKAVTNICPDLLALIKPQFEATKAQMVGTGGLCPEQLHGQIIEQVTQHALTFGYELLKIAPCPIKGKIKGNVEYVSLWRKKQW